MLNIFRLANLVAIVLLVGCNNPTPVAQHTDTRQPTELDLPITVKFLSGQECADFLDTVRVKFNKEPHPPGYWQYLVSVGMAYELEEFDLPSTHIEIKCDNDRHEFESESMSQKFYKEVMRQWREQGVKDAADKEARLSSNLAAMGIK
jgi:hypothetical protein